MNAVGIYMDGGTVSFSGRSIEAVQRVASGMGLRSFRIYVPGTAGGVERWMNTSGKWERLVADAPNPTPADGDARGDGRVFHEFTGQWACDECREDDHTGHWVCVISDCQAADTVPCAHQRGQAQGNRGTR